MRALSPLFTQELCCLKRLFLLIQNEKLPSDAMQLAAPWDIDFLGAQLCTKVHTGFRGKVLELRTPKLTELSPTHFSAFLNFLRARVRATERGLEEEEEEGGGEGREEEEGHIYVIHILHIYDGWPFRSVVQLLKGGVIQGRVALFSTGGRLAAYKTML